MGQTKRYKQPAYDRGNGWKPIYDVLEKRIDALKLKNRVCVRREIVGTRRMAYKNGIGSGRSNFSADPLATRE